MEEKNPEKILWQAVYGMLPKNHVKGCVEGSNYVVAKGAHSETPNLHGGEPSACSSSP